MDKKVFVIWLDNNIDESKEDYSNMLTQLRHIANTVKTFQDGDKCVTFLSETKNGKVYLIVSGSLGQNIVPIVHDMSQVNSIFVFCSNRKVHERWANEWPKIKGIFTEITPICEALRQAVHKFEHSAMAISSEASMKNSDELDSSFMYTQIFKEILLSIDFDEEYIKKFIDYCRQELADNDVELKNVKEMERNYRNETPIWWYTYASFLHPMLECALGTMDMDIMINMAFFISDLHRHIEQLYSEQFGNGRSGKVFTVYRGDGLLKTKFEQIMTKKGGLISYNNFLCASKDQKVSLNSARSAATNSDLVGVLFVMTIDPSISSTPFASINNVRYSQNTKDEVLFSMHTVFRIREIKQLGENNRLWQVDMTLTTDNDPQLQALTERIREEIDPNSNGWSRLSKMLLKIGQFNQAERIHEMMLEQTTDDREKANIYQQRGRTKSDQGEYEEAITFYEKSLKISQKILPPNHLDLADSYDNIGSVYNEMGEHSKALSFYEKALAIKEKNLPQNHPNLADCYNNLGGVYDNMKEYSTALSFYEKTLKIREKILPPNHPNLADCYSNIGSVYNKMGDYSKAVSFYKRALDIGEHSFPPNHPTLQKWRQNLDLVKKKL